MKEVVPTYVISKKNMYLSLGSQDSLAALVAGMPSRCPRPGGVSEPVREGPLRPDVVSMLGFFPRGVYTGRYRKRRVSERTRVS
jgi:hypothetical protein